MSFCEEEKRRGERIDVRKVVERVARATGLSKRSVSDIRMKGVEGYPDDDEKEIRERESTVPVEWHAIIRGIMAGKFAHQESVTLDTLMDALEEGHRLRDDPEFIWSRATLHRLLHRLGYSQNPQRSYYDVLKQKQHVQAERAAYIRAVQHYRDTDYSIWYQDETWFNKNMTASKHWMDRWP